MAELSVITERDDFGESSITVKVDGFVPNPGFESFRMAVGLLELAMKGSLKAAMSALADAEWLERFADDMESDTVDAPDPDVTARLRRIAAVLREATPEGAPERTESEERAG